VTTRLPTSADAGRVNAHRKLELGLLDQVPLAVVIATRDGRIRYWSRAAEEVYGWSKRDAIGRRLETLGASEAAAAALREALDDVGSGGCWSGEVSFRHRSGATVRADVRSSPLQSPAEDTIGVILVAAKTVPAMRRSDSTELARIGRRIAQARKAAGLTQEELAVRVGVTRRSIQGYEAGSVSPYRHLDQLAEAVQRSQGWLLSDSHTGGRTLELPAELKAELRTLIREELASTLRRAELARADPAR
jgi:PAS domain S-box-containing protein